VVMKSDIERMQNSEYLCGTEGIEIDRYGNAEDLQQRQKKI